MAASQKKPEVQWTADKRKAANLDQRLKNLIISVLQDDQMNFVMNFLTAKSTWDDLILYHKGPFDVKESRYKALMSELVNDGINISKLEINTGFINGLPKKWLSFCQSLRNTNHVKDFKLVFQDIPEDEEDTRSSHEYLNDLEEEYQARDLLAKIGHFARDCFAKTSVPSYQSLFHSKQVSSSMHKPKLRPTKDFEAKYNKVKTKLALLSSSASPSKSTMIKNKGLIAEAYEWDKEDVSSDENEMTEVKVLMALAEENDVVSNEGAINGEWVKISMRKVHTLLEMEDNDDRKTYLDYLSDDTKVSIPGVERPWLSKADSFILPNHDTVRILPSESQVNTTDPSVGVTDSSATDYDSADESSVCSTPLPPLEKLDGIKPVYRPKTIKSILKSNSTFKAETLKNVIINIPSSPPAKINKKALAPKINSAPAGKLKNVKTKDDFPLSGVMKELNDLKLQISKNQSSYSRINTSQQVPPNALQNKYKTQFKRNCEFCGLNNHLSRNCYKVLFCKKCERTDHITCDHVEYMSTMNITHHLKSQASSSSRQTNPRPSKHFFPLCIHCGFSNHLPSDCTNYPICDICGSFDHNTYGYNRIISQRRGIKPKNPQHVPNRRKTCGSTVHTTSDHNDIEWFRRGEASQSKNVEIPKLKRPEASNATRSKTLTQSGCSRHMTGVKSYLHKYVEQPGPKVVFRDDSTCITEGYGSIKCNGIVFTKVAFVNGLKYNLVSISQLCDAKVFNTRKQQTKETYHITFYESIDAIKFTKPLVDNLNITDSMRYPPDEFLHHYEPSQKYQINNNEVSFIYPYKRPDPGVLETKAPNDQNDQSDHHAQENDFQNDDHPKHSNHNNDSPIIETLNTKVVQDSSPIIENIINTNVTQDYELTSSLVEDTSIHNTIPNISSSSIPSTPLPVAQDRWSQDKHIEPVNIIGDLRAGMLTRAMDKTLSAASAHECLFVDFLSEEEPKKVSEALKHTG
ncbi:hypothetical protein Tco_0312451 [Tanacetum coccineum]